MSRDIGVDIQELKSFLDTLRNFQDQMQDSFKTLELDWQICDDSWEGNSKQKFAKDFTETLTEVQSSLKAGDEASDWLERFYEILREFEES